MKTIRAIAATASMISASFAAQAELVNISSVGQHTASENAIACTIVDTGTTPINGAVLLVFFAEGNGAGNPNIRVWSLNRSYVATNENWMDGVDVTSNGATQHINLADVYPQDPLYYPSLLRAPYRPTDAAVFVAGLRGEAFCAESYDSSGLGTPQRVSISSTDMNAIIFKSMQVKESIANDGDSSKAAAGIDALK
jgi:hypothetical protein